MKPPDLGLLQRRGVVLAVRAWSTHGGTERYCHGFSHWLMERGVHPEVWCQRIDLPSDGVRLRALRPVGRGRIGRMFATNLAVRSLPSAPVKVGFLRAPGFDVFRAGGGAHSAWVRHLGVSKMADRVECALDARALASAGRVVVNSELAKQDVLRDGHATTERVVVVRNGVNLDRFSPLPETEREQAIVFVGHGFARKGLSTALRALTEVPDVVLRVVGRERREGRYRTLAHRLGVASRVQFLGAVDDVASVMRRARALILPTRYDPSANVVLEAMACAVPPVTTRFDGASEVVPMPWLVVDEPTDASAFANAIQRAMSDPRVAERCREAASVWSRERSYAEFATTIIDVAKTRVET